MPLTDRRIPQLNWLLKLHAYLDQVHAFHPFCDRTRPLTVPITATVMGKGESR